MDKPKDPDSPERPGGKDSEDAPYVSPRLRSKLSAAEDLDFEEAEKDSKAQNMMAIGMFAVLIIVGAFLGYSMFGPKKAEEPAPEPEPVAAADTTAADSLAADTTATPKPAPKPATPPPAQTAQEPETPPTPFGIAVGAYIDEARANEELQRLQGATGLSGKIDPFDDGGITSYRVVLGSFNSRGSADAKANDLIGQDIVYEARVVPIR